jgi:hypothetical protein
MDFIINYGIERRMGPEAESDEEDAWSDVHRYRPGTGAIACREGVNDGG